MTHPTQRFWSPDDGICGLCGIEFPDRIPEIEMFHPENVDEIGSFVVHLSCGRSAGMEEA